MKINRSRIGVFIAICLLVAWLTIVIPSASPDAPNSIETNQDQTAIEQGESQPIAWSESQLREFEAEALLQKRLAEEWQKKDSLKSLEAKIQLAIKCMRTMPGGGVSMFDSKVGLQTTRKAKEFLLAHKNDALPVLLAYVAANKDNSRGKNCLAHTYDVLAEIGSRETVVLLVDRLLQIDDTDAMSLGILAQAIAKFGDPDVIPQLLKVYPYQRDFVQDTILYVPCMAQDKNAVPILIDWALGNANGEPNYAVVSALAYQKDPRAESALRSILAMPRARMSWRHALYGLHLLGHNITELGLSADKQFMAAQIKAKPYPRTIYPYRFQGANLKLRAFIAQHLASNKKVAPAAVSDGGLSLSLTASPQVVISGASVTFSAKITNQSKQAVTVMRSRDGSDSESVMPRIRVNILGPDHRRAGFGGGGCGNLNPLVKSDILALKPGATLDLFSDPNAFGHSALQGFSTAVPGTYRVQMIYDTTGQASGGIGDNGTLPNGVAAVHLVSNEIKVKVIAKSPTTLNSGSGATKRVLKNNITQVDRINRKSNRVEQKSATQLQQEQIQQLREREAKKKAGSAPK